MGFFLSPAMTAPCTFLLDNGSLAPASVLRLREIARELARRIGAPVAPVSLLHSTGIAAEALGGVPAEIFESALLRRAAAGEGEFLVVPLFFGPSRALTVYLPERVQALRSRCPGLRVRLAPPLFAADDRRLARILADQVRAVGGGGRVALVDHGSPVPEVAAVRETLAGQLRRELGGETVVAGCCMERRPEAEYDFNGPRLADLLGQEGWRDAAVTVAQQFLLPGRHAGPDGDVAAICRRAASVHPRLHTRLTPLVGEHPQLVDVLADRWLAGRARQPV